MPQPIQASPEQALAAFAERAPRSETNWIAMIRTSEGMEIPCTVKDVSKTGAKIAVSDSYHLPDDFMLKVVGKDYVCRVKLAWRRGHYAGLRIEQIAKIAPKPVAVVEVSRTGTDPSYKAIGARRSKVSTF